VGLKSSSSNSMELGDELQNSIGSNVHVRDANARIVPEVQNPHNGVSRPLYGRLLKRKQMLRRFNNFGTKKRNERKDMNLSNRTCIEAINCIARMSRQMQFKIAKMFWLQRNRRPMKTEINGLPCGNVDQTGRGSHNGQLEEVFATNATGNAVNPEATVKVPASQPASITSTCCSGSSIASAPVQPTCVCQLRERDTQFDNTCVDSLSQNRDMYASNNYREFMVPMSEYSSRNYCGQHAIPRVRMARTKMTARKDRDDMMNVVLKRGEVVNRLNHHLGGDAEGHLLPKSTYASSVRKKTDKESITRDTW